MPLYPSPTPPPAFSLLLSRGAPLSVFFDEKRARLALQQGPSVVAFAANAPSAFQDETAQSAKTLHLVFDWDSTLVDAEGDRHIQTHGRPSFEAQEWEQQHLPLKPGPLFALLAWAQGRNDVRTSILTARTAREAPRVLTTLAAWRFSVDALHCAANQRKGPIAAAIGAHLFFDDILRHVNDVTNCGVSAGWVPYGMATQ